MLFDGGRTRLGLTLLFKNITTLNHMHHSYCLNPTAKSQSVIQIQISSKRTSMSAIAKMVVGAPLAKVGWTVTHIKGDYEPRILKDCLDARFKYNLCLMRPLRHDLVVNPICSCRSNRRNRQPFRCAIKQWQRISCD